jgi:hypothetical protein
LYGIDHSLRPAVKAGMAPLRILNIVNVVLWAIQRALQVNTRVRYVAHEVSKGAAHTEAGPATMLQIFAKRWEQTTWNLVYLAHDLAIVIPRLVHHKMPHAIRVKTVPLVIRTKKLQVGLIRLRTRVITIQTQTRTLLRLRIKIRLRHLERRVFVRIPLQIGRATTRATRAQRTANRADVNAKKARWTWAYAGASAAVVAGLRAKKALPLLCKENVNFARELCLGGPGTGRRIGRGLKDLFALAFPALGLLAMCDLYKAFLFLGENVIEPVLRGLVVATDDLASHCGENLGSAMDSPGYGKGWLLSAHD